MELTPTDRNPTSESGIGGEKMGLVRPRKNRRIEAAARRNEPEERKMRRRAARQHRKL
jgi:hypothetical protein